MTTVREAIQSLNSSAQFSVGGNSIDSIKWLNGTTKISKADIQAEIDRLNKEYDAQEYARKRAEEYPSIAELTVALYDEDDKTAIEAKRAAVKKKWPKDNSGPVE